MNALHVFTVDAHQHVWDAAQVDYPRLGADTDAMFAIAVLHDGRRRSSASFPCSGSTRTRSRRSSSIRPGGSMSGLRSDHRRRKGTPADATEGSVGVWSGGPAGWRKRRPICAEPLRRRRRLTQARRPSMLRVG